MSVFKIELIRDYIAERRMSKATFCGGCGISVGTLNKILGGGINISIATLFKIAEVMRVDVREFFGDDT